MSARPLTTRDIERLFRKLNAELAKKDIRGEVHLVGGAVLCLVHAAREATRDVDGFFRPARELRAAAARVAIDEGVPENWLNDAVKGFFSEHGTFNLYEQLSHLTIYVADPSYLLAMKSLSARIGEEFHDIDDIRYLLRYLNLATAAEARAVIEQYYPIERFPQKTHHLLEELLAES
jgi:Nucleotidyltransferase of unknown function (DUF6036)